MPKQREYVIVETSDGSAANIARLTRDARHAHANVKHRRELDADEFDELIEERLAAKGPLDVEVASKTRQPENVTCYFVCVGPKGKAKAFLDAHMAGWT